MTRDAVDLVLQLWDDPKPGVYEHKFWRFTVPEPNPDIGLSFHYSPTRSRIRPSASPASRSGRTRSSLRASAATSR